MNDEKLFRLIQQEVDGTNTDRESITLHEYCSLHPEARKLLDEHRALARTLEKIPAVNPPARIRAEIIRGIHPGRSPLVRRPAVFSRVFSSVAAFRPPYIAYAAAAVVIIVALVTFQSKYRDLVGNGRVIGTIGGATTAPPLNSDQSFDVSVAGISGTVQFEHDQGKTLVDLSLHSATGCEVTIDYDPNAIQFDSFIPSNGDETSLKTLPGQVTLTHRGDASYRIAFTATATPRFPLAFQFFSAGNLVFEQSEHLP